MDEATQSQLSYIIRLLDERRISRASAERIINILMDEPFLSDPGLETLKMIQRPS